MPETPDEIKARHKLELDIATLESDLIALKASGDDSDKLRKVKDKLRAARQSFRESRDEGTVSPSPIEASASVKEG